METKNEERKYLNITLSSIKSTQNLTGEYQFSIKVETNFLTEKFKLCNKIFRFSHTFKDKDKQLLSSYTCLASNIKGIERYLEILPIELQTMIFDASVEETDSPKINPITGQYN